HERGPRTGAGKARVSQNALRHGLAVSILEDPAVSAEVDRLARALTDGEEDHALLAQARILAEAGLDLERTQITKASLINSHLVAADPSAPPPGAKLAGACRHDCPADAEILMPDVEAHADSAGTAMINAV